jgi:putative peptidoglycan lipid II flippase
LYYADRLIEFPLGLFGIGIATVILPALSKLHAKDSIEEFQQTLDWGVRFVIFLGIPAMAGLMLISPLIISVLFGHGEFNQGEHDNVAAVSGAVTAYSVGLVSFMLIKVLAPGFFARQDTKTPVKIGIIAMSLNMLFNLMLAPFIGYLGLALATALSATCNAALLYRQLNQQGVYRVSRFTIAFTAKCILSSLVMSGVLIWLNRQLSWQGNDLITQIGLLGLQLVAAILVYFSMMYLMGVRLSTLKDSSAAPVQPA